MQKAVEIVSIKREENGGISALKTQIENEKASFDKTRDVLGILCGVFEYTRSEWIFLISDEGR
jgi:hypothetical protein